MRRLSELPAAPGLRLVRPLLGIPKARLLATLKAAKIGYADDPSNRDPRFTRARFRKLMEALAAEGLGSDALALLVDRLARAADALAAAAERLADEMFIETAGPLRIALETTRFAALPDEFRLRLIGRAIDRVGDEGPVELGKLEALKCALDAALLAKTPLPAQPGRRAGDACRRDHPGRNGPATAFENLNHASSRRGGRGKNALEYAESGLCRPACAAYIGMSLRREFAPNAGQG